MCQGDFLCVCVYSQAKSERNYHIFYEMLAGLPPHEKHSLYLQEAETYYYLNQVLKFKHADIHQISKKITRTLTSCRVTISITATSVSLKLLSLDTKIQWFTRGTLEFIHFSNNSVCKKRKKPSNLFFPVKDFKCSRPFPKQLVILQIIWQINTMKSNFKMLLNTFYIFSRRNWKQLSSNKMYTHIIVYSTGQTLDSNTLTNIMGWRRPDWLNWILTCDCRFVVSCPYTYYTRWLTVQHKHVVVQLFTV